MSAEKINQPSTEQPCFVLSAVNISGSDQIVQLLNAEFYKEGVYIAPRYSGVSYNEIIRSLIAYPITVSKIFVKLKNISGLYAHSLVKENYWEQIKTEVVTKNPNGSIVIIALEMIPERSGDLIASSTEFRIDTLTYINMFLPANAVVEVFVYAKAKHNRNVFEN